MNMTLCYFSQDSVENKKYVKNDKYKISGMLLSSQIKNVENTSILLINAHKCIW